MTDTFTHREIRASLLTFYMIAVTRILSYVTSFILLFLLTPFDFGLMAVIISIIVIANSVTTLGLDSALVSLRGDERPYLNDAWTLDVIKGLALAATLAVSAKHIATFLEQPLLEGPLTLMSMAFVLQSIKNVGLTSLRKRLEFREIFWCEFGMALVQCVLTLTIAYANRSAWALVFGYLGGWLAYVILSFALCSYRPAFGLNMSNVKELWRYSRWVLAGGQVNSAVENSINIFVSSLFGLAVLGQLERADMFTRKTATQIGEVVWKVGLPALSMRWADPSGLTTRYFSLYRFMCWISIPSMIIVSVYLPAILTAKDPDGWSSFPDLVAILAIAAALQAFTIPASVLFQASRRPQLGMKIASVKLAVVIICLLPTVSYFGIISVPYAILAASTFTALLSILEANRLIETTFFQHALIASEYAIPSFVFLSLSPGGKPLILDLLYFIVACMAYGLILLCCSRSSYRIVKGAVCAAIIRLDKTRSGNI